MAYSYHRTVFKTTGKWLDFSLIREAQTLHRFVIFEFICRLYVMKILSVQYLSESVLIICIGSFLTMLNVTSEQCVIFVVIFWEKDKFDNCLKNALLAKH